MAGRSRTLRAAARPTRRFSSCCWSCSICAPLAPATFVLPPLDNAYVLRATYRRKAAPSKARELIVGSRGYWLNKNNLLRAVQRAEDRLGLSKPEDWYSVTLEDLKQVGEFPSGMTRRKLVAVLRERYPDGDWDQMLLLRGRYTQQRKLEKAVADLFPNVAISINARKEAGLINPATGDYMELDVYIPSLNLAFEYQERHHFTSSDNTYGTVDAVQERDELKKRLVDERGIALVVVPCWWDGNIDSLVASIKKVRPDVLPSIETTAAPIPNQPPPGFLETQSANIEGIGPPTNASFFTMANANPVDWWLFEKYDGVRGFWNPVKRTMYSRSGKQLHLPDEVIDSLPQHTFLDGELWFGRDNFQEAMKISGRADPAAIDWSRFKYMVYDIPDHHGKYEQRYTELVNRLSNQEWKYVVIAPKETCRGTDHMESFFQDVVDQGGEGVILRDPNALYQPGRSPGYLKHKKYRDSEARVVRTLDNGERECELPNGCMFTAPGTTEFGRRWNPQPGAIVTFKHRGFLLTTKRPKLPMLFRVRTDLSWSDILEHWKEQRETPPLQGGRAAFSGRPLSPRPKRYWQDTEHRRRFFLELAKDLGIDPYNPDHWSQVKKSQIEMRKGAALLGMFGGSLRLALQQTFPELQQRAWPILQKKHSQAM